MSINVLFDRYVYKRICNAIFGVWGIFLDKEISWSIFNLQNVNKP